MPLLLIVAAGILFAAWLTWRSSNLMWRIDIEQGRVVRVAGTPPGAFVSAVREIVAMPPVVNAQLVARRGDVGAVLEIRGVDPGRRQRLQNVFRLQPSSTLRGTPNPVNEENVRRAYTLAQLLRWFRRW